MSGQGKTPASGIPRTVPPKATRMLAESLHQWGGGVIASVSRVLEELNEITIIEHGEHKTWREECSH